MTTQQSVHHMLHYPLVRMTCTQKHTHTHKYTHWSDCDKSLAVGEKMLFQGGLNSKTAWVTRSLLTWMSAHRTKHTKIYRLLHTDFPPPDITEQSSDKYTPQISHWSITHRCSLRTRGTRHPSLARGALHRKERKRGKLQSFSDIEDTHHYHGWQPLPWFQEYQVCHLFHQYPADPERAGRWLSRLFWHTFWKLLCVGHTLKCNTHILSLFANRTLWALDTSAALQKTSKSTSVFSQSTSE